MGGGGGKTPEVPAPIVQSPAPIPMATSVSPQLTEGQRAKKIAQLKQGVMSTIKTSPQGVSGTGSDLNSQGQPGNKTLGGG